MCKDILLKKGGIIFLVICFIIVIIGIVFQYVKQRDIAKNKEKVIGIVVKIDYKSNASYSLEYEYVVDGKLYNGSKGVSFFKCEDGRKGCVGSEFTVYYSSKNPEHSRIDLGKYEKYKKTVEFVK